MPNAPKAALTLEDNLKVLFDKMSPVMMGLQTQWRNTNFLALFDAKNIFKKFNDIYQAIIESFIYVSAATIVSICVAAITSMMSKILFAISLALFVKAAFDAINNDDESAVEMGFYGASTLLLSYLVNITSLIVAIATLALLVYKSSDLIEKSLPSEFKDTWTSRAQSFFKTINHKIDETQAFWNNQFGVK